MTVSISNMAQVWMSNTNTYNGIAMSISTMGYGANSSSRLLYLRVDGNTKFDIDANGNIVTSNSIFANTITSNNITANSIFANTITSNNITANTITTKNLKFTTVTVASLPLASDIGVGGRAFVTDANQNSFLANVFSGGSNVVPVFSDGTRWKIG